MKKDHRLGIYEKAMPNSMTIPEKLCCAKDFGFDFMELSIDETPEKLARLDMSGDERLRLVSDMAIFVPIRTICLSGHRKYPLGSMDPEIRRESLHIMERAIRLACDLGVRVIQIAGYDVYYEDSTAETGALFLEGLRESVGIASAHGVILAFETMETPFMNNVKKAMVYVNELDSPYLQVYPDIGNCTNAAVSYNEDILQDLWSGKGHIAAVHLKETEPGKFREIEYGKGHVDFARVIKAAMSLGVRLYVTEFWDDPQKDYKERIACSKQFIDRIFAGIHC